MANRIARDIQPKVMRVSLAEFRALGRFVRWEDVPNALERHAEGDEFRSYPIFDSWLPPHEWIDVLEENTWKRVRFVAFDPRDETLKISEGGRKRIIPVDRFCVAPAGYFTDCDPDLSNAWQAKLQLSRFEYPNRVLEEAWVKDVSPPYITFQVMFHDESDRSTDWFTEETMHAADPRVDVDGVKSREPIFNHTIAVSHRWLSATDPDPDGSQYREFMQLCGEFDYCSEQVFLFDYMSLPQNLRTVEHEKFKYLLSEFQEHFSRRVFLLNTGAEDFQTRAWCMLELMLAAIEGTILNEESISSSIRTAYALATKYEEQSRYDQYNREKPPRLGDDDTKAMYGHIRATAKNYREEIEETFLKQLKVTREQDRSLILWLLRELCFKRRV